MKRLILIKLGGSIITDKSKAFTPRIQALKRLVKEIKQARFGKKSDVIIGHGSGSFGHTVADKYKTQLGLINRNSLTGFPQVADAAIKINRIVMGELLKTKVNAVSFSPFSFVYARSGKPDKILTRHIKKALEIGLTPVIYGDVVMDNTNGFCIFSGEKTIDILASEFKKDYESVRIILASDTDGIYDKKGKTIKVINHKNFSKVKVSVKGSGTKDVTGGMLHKFEEAYLIAQKEGIKTIIVNGNKKGELYRAILGLRVKGTQIEK